MTEWVKTIEAEVGDVLPQHHIFWKVQDIIRGNPQLANARSHLFAWMGDVFVASAAVAVRRQVDNHDDTICLRRLLRAGKRTHGNRHPVFLPVGIHDARHRSSAKRAERAHLRRAGPYQ
jgi:hypothetical protein